MTILGHLSKDKQIQRKFTELLFAIRENGGVECEQVPDIFFPEDRDWRLVKSEIALAKSICRDCPIKNLCAEYGMVADEPFGIWGGLTPQERTTLRKLKSTS